MAERTLPYSDSDDEDNSVPAFKLGKKPPVPAPVMNDPFEMLPPYTPPKPMKSPEMKPKYLAEHELRVLFCDWQMKIASNKTYRASAYEAGKFITSNLEDLQREKRIPDVDSARSVQHTPETRCLLYMRTLCDPIELKERLKKEFPAKDPDAILNNVKQSNKSEFKDYNSRMHLKNFLFNTEGGTLSPPSTPSKEKTPKKDGKSPNKDKDDSDNNNKKKEEKPVFVDGKPSKIDLANVGSPSGLVKKVVWFKHKTFGSKEKPFHDYVLYAKQKDAMIVIHLNARKFMEKHTAFIKKPLEYICGTVTNVEECTAKKDNRYGLQEGTKFYVVDIKFKMSSS